MPTIEETNKLIAEFMGNPIYFVASKTTGLPIFYSHTTYLTTEEVEVKIKDDGWLSNCAIVGIKPLTYHSDWNMLMQVVERIEAIHLMDVAIFELETIITDPVEDCFAIYGHGDNRLSSLYAAVVEFIEWYNIKK